ncbi:late competence development ComFB family protein [Pseudoalteromonas luteoviolacea]|uniref:Late competence development protein ComFB n=1 Tax=Pseudoalteromonas luteoviolacea H33 TaxID=1365251 RepID=A0A167G795_9GAMM|nr:MULTISPECIES: late competence development ComFB family protein [Pseudoalteromonas]KZN54190.1 Late competence development protein ComFB [Pseudoalteromonas luteoviolacea H33]KZN78279.1 Late competence development protein ComFB [Pseudoalteromonas luteoviolacea H33-S]MBQ4877466.1 late competence development ComFB family protein [Pseudoalteromonas luteoviolacea]MBQ4906435.1 late competence development ComFB family protein [Pseudoalteromonas luteoviolacea]MCF6438232.1 late competence development 
MKLHDDLHNYYEKVMIEQILERKLNDKYDDNVMADFCCTVLNQLPARYIRYDVDMEFYLPQSERQQMEERVKIAIDVAIEQVSKKRQFSNE